jgi:outer membrane protein insertion porin family
VRVRVFFSVLVLALAVGLARAEEPVKPVVAEVKVIGGQTISAETVEYYLGVAEGDAFDAAVVAANFHRLWDSGLVEDVKVETEDVEGGKVRVVVTVVERPKVSDFAFKGNKKLSTSTIREKLDADGISLKRNVPLKDSDLQRFRRAIMDAYAKDGYASAVVTTVVEEAGANLRKVTFQVDEGAKIHIGKINFEGNELYSDSRLRKSMKKLKQKSIWRMFGKKLIWSKEAWGEDSENVKKYYMNRGYKDVLVGEPKVDLVAGNPEGATQKKKKFRMFVNIPVEEGKQFRLGSVKLEGNTVFPEDRLRKVYEGIKPGKIYNYGSIETGSEAVRSLYQSRGYIYAYTNQQAAARADEPDMVDVKIVIYEGERYRLGRLEFSGNTKTQDKVLRREFRLLEGSYMDMNIFRKSVFKVNQLGYFKLTDDPLEFKFEEEKKLVNVTVKGQEVGRTDVQFGAGYSELDHFFFQFMFNTRNFLGRGETLGVAVSTGSRADSYSLSFSEPYFLDRRMVIGGSIYNQSMDITDYERESRGGSVVWGVGAGDFGQFSVSYSYEDVYAKYSVVRQILAGGEPYTPHQRPLPPPYSSIPQPPLFYDVFTGVTSSITPSIGSDTRDDPFDPSQGFSYFGRLRFAGGPLGGDFNYWRPEVGATAFYPLTRRYILAGNVEAGIINPFSGSEIPTYDRYRLGGERSLRGLPYYGVLPRTEKGLYFLSPGGARLGGDRYFQLNLEYQIKVGGPIKFILFSDIGNTWHEDQGWDLGLLRYTTGAELRIFLPIFQAPLRFIYGVNLDPFPDEKSSDFQFSIGTTF